MPTVGQMVVDLTMNTTRIRQDVEQVKGTLTGLQTAVGSVGKAFAALGGAYGLKELVMGVVDLGEEMAKTSLRTGIAVEKLAQYRYATKLADTDLQAVTKAIGIMSTKILDAQNSTSEMGKAFKLLGIDAKKALTEDTSKVFDEVIEKLNLVDSTIGQMALAKGIFGRGALEIMPFIKELDEARKRAQDLGITMSKEFAESSEEFNDNIQSMKLELQNLLIVAVNPLVEGFNNFFASIGKAPKLQNLYSQIARVKDDIEALESGGPFGLFKPQPGSIAEKQLQNLRKVLADLAQQTLDLQSANNKGKISGDAVARAFGEENKSADELTRTLERLQNILNGATWNESQKDFITLGEIWDDLAKKGLLNEQATKAWNKAFDALVSSFESKNLEELFAGTNKQMEDAVRIFQQIQEQYKGTGDEMLRLFKEDQDEQKRLMELVKEELGLHIDINDQLKMRQQLIDAAGARYEAQAKAFGSTGQILSQLGTSIGGNTGAFVGGLGGIFNSLSRMNELQADIAKRQEKAFQEGTKFNLSATDYLNTAMAGIAMGGSVAATYGALTGNANARTQFGGTMGGLATALFVSTNPALIAVGSLLGSILGGMFNGEEDWPRARFRYRPGEETPFKLQENNFSFDQEKTWNKIFTDFRDNLLEFSENVGLETDKFFQDYTGRWIEDFKESDLQELFGMMAERWTGIDWEQWQKAGEEIPDTVNRIVNAVTGLPTTFAEFGDAFRILADDFSQADEMLATRRGINTQLDQLNDALDKVTDPADAIQYATAIERLLVQRYELERDYIIGIQKALHDAKIELMNFVISLQQRIDAARGTFTTYGTIQGMAGNWQALYAGASTPDEALDLINQAVAMVDAALASRLEEIAASQNAQQAIQNNDTAIYQQQLQVIEQWKSLRDSLDQSILQLQLSGANPANALERLGIARAEVDRLRGVLSGATGAGRVAAASDLQNALESYLQIAGEAYQRPSTEYQNIYNEVISGLESLRDEADSYAQLQADIQAEIASSSGTVATNTSSMDAAIKAAKAEAAEYYEWLKNEGIRQYNLKIDKLNADLTAILGDQTAEEYLADLQLTSATELTKIRSLMEDFLAASIPNYSPRYPSPVTINEATGTVSGSIVGVGRFDTSIAEAMSWLANSGAQWINATNTEPAYILYNGVKYPIKYMQEGGFVPSNTFAYLHAGETVVPKGGGTIYINPHIEITMSAGASPSDVGRAVEDAVVNSIRFGKGRRAVREAVQYG